MFICSCQPEDEEEVGGAPNPGYSICRVPVWHESSRTGGGRKFRQDSEQRFPPFSNSQVCKEASWVVSSEVSRKWKYEWSVDRPPLRVLWHNRRVQHCQYPTLEDSLRWCCHDYTSLLQALHNQLLSYKSLARWNPVPKLSIPLSRMPLAGSGVGEWLATTGHMNHTRVRVHWRRIYKNYPRISLWRVFPHLIGIWYTYGRKTVS